MAWFLSKGVMLRQHKQPAAGAKLREFLNSETELSEFELSDEKARSIGGDDIISIAQKCQIVDERDTQPLWKKLSDARERGVINLVIDAVDHEPYVSSQTVPMLTYKQEVEKAILLAMRASGAVLCSISVYHDTGKESLKVPGKIGKYKIKKVYGNYPVISETITSLGQDPRNVTVGVCSLIHLYRAVYNARVQSTVFVTVSGDAVVNHMNLEVSLGMTVGQVLDRCGVRSDAARIVSGGSMTGISLIDPDETVITHSARAILAFTHKRADGSESCIGCGRCLKVCPRSLSPVYIVRYSRKKQFSKLLRLDINDCIECGCCAYICPAKIDHIEHIRYGKEQIVYTRQYELAKIKKEKRYLERQHEIDHKENTRREAERAKAAKERQKIIDAIEKQRRKDEKIIADYESKKLAAKQTEAKKNRPEDTAAATSYSAPTAAEQEKSFEDMGFKPDNTQKDIFFSSGTQSASSGNQYPENDKNFDNPF